MKDTERVGGGLDCKERTFHEEQEQQQCECSEAPEDCPFEWNEARPKPTHWPGVEAYVIADVERR